MIVRDASSKDFEFIVMSQIKMALETENLKLDKPTVRLGVRAVLEDKSKGAYIVAEEQGKPCGVLLTVPEWSDWRNGTVVWIHSLYVIPEMRKSGVFRKMYEHLQSAVKSSKNLRGIRLYVEQNNLRAQKAYENMGMSKDHYFLYEWLK